MVVLEQHKTAKFGTRWYFRCCYGCNGCAGALFGPYATEHDALLARDGKETMHERQRGPAWVHPDGSPIYSAGSS